MAILTFPSLVGLAFPITRKTTWSTAREESVAGYTARYARRVLPRYTWTVTFDVLRQNHNGVTGELATLIGFFNSIRGGAYPFFYRDVDDSVATNQSFGSGNGTATTFQLLRTLGGFSEPVFGNPTVTEIRAAGVPVSPAGYSVSQSGVVTFTSAPANGAALTWDGSFYWLCEMDADELSTRAFASGLYSGQELSFSSKILPP